MFLDLVIVVVGVFLGLQAQDWNRRGRTGRSNINIFSACAMTLRSPSRTPEINIKRMQREFRLEGLMVARLRECRLDETQRADFAEGIYLLGRFEPPPLVRGTIDELRSSGRMAIIENLTLRHKISEAVRAQDKEAQVLGYIIDRATPDIVYIDQRTILIQPPGGFTKPARPDRQGASCSISPRSVMTLPTSLPYPQCRN